MTSFVCKYLFAPYALSFFVSFIYLSCSLTFSISSGHHKQVELYADCDPKMLLPFLRSSQHYTLEKVCLVIWYSISLYNFWFLTVK